MPAPIIPTSKHAYHPECLCAACAEEFFRRLRTRNVHEYGFQPADPLRAFKGIVVWFSVSVITILMVLGVLWLAFAPSVHGATNGSPRPVAAPESLTRARAACPNTASLVQCRSALVRAYSAVRWQRHARWQASASTSRDVVRDAITWASQQTGVPAWRLTNIASCESHLYYLAHNGQYLGVWQLGATHRSDPIFRVVPWMDPYAQAIHVARFIKAHGESQWQCSSSGGLRW